MNDKDKKTKKKYTAKQAVKDSFKALRSGIRDMGILYREATKSPVPFSTKKQQEAYEKRKKKKSYKSGGKTKDFRGNRQFD